MIGCLRIFNLLLDFGYCILFISKST